MFFGDGALPCRHVGMFCTTQAMPPMMTSKSTSGMTNRVGDFVRTGGCVPGGGPARNASAGAPGYCGGAPARIVSDADPGKSCSGMLDQVVGCLLTAKQLVMKLRGPVVVLL